MKSFVDKKFCTWCGGKLKIINENHLLCQSCDTSDYNNPKGAVPIIVINENDEVLVGKRANEPQKGLIDVPGGFIDSDETANQCAKRELFEETGLEIDEKDFRLVDSCAHTYEYEGKSYLIIDLIYIVRIKGSPKLSSNDDIASLEWMDPQDIDFTKFWMPELSASIQAYLAQQNML